MFLKKILSSKEWLIVEDGYHPERNNFHETIFTLANGYVGTRGALEEGSQTSCPGTYFAGVFDETPTYNTELANSPNWLGLKIIACGEPINLERGRILEFRRWLDMKNGILARLLRWKDDTGRITRLESFRLVHLEKKHQVLIRGVIVPENYTGKISLRSSLDGNVSNTTLTKRMRIKHYRLNEYQDLKDRGIYLEMETVGSNNVVGEASRLHIEEKESRSIEIEKDKISEIITFPARNGKQYQFEKYVSFYTCRDVKNVKRAVLRELSSMSKQGSEKIFSLHKEVWKKRWKDADIVIDGDERAQKAIRFNIFQMAQHPNAEDESVSIAAKGLTGEGYRGHIFWDTEIYLLPFYIYTNPDAARALLMYRYNTLDGARKNARANGYRGAQYPWESAENGEEVCPKEFVNPFTGEIEKPYTDEEEHHIVADVAYVLDHYLRATGDEKFKRDYGTEIMIETARFWASRVQFDRKKKKYVIRKVIGPDEAHDHTDNNFYTNYLARWNMLAAVQYVEELKCSSPRKWNELRKKIGFDDGEIAEWKNIADRIYFPSGARGKLCEEFEGYFKLKDLVITKFDGRGMPIITTEQYNNRYQYTLIKQADIVLLHYLFNDDFDEETKRENFIFYAKRTTHKSSLSPSMYALMGAEVGEHKKAHENFVRSALMDLEDKHGNTHDGIHCGALGGTWQAVVNGFGGMRTRENRLVFTPRLPKLWRRLAFKLKWRGAALKIEIDKEMLKVSLDKKSPQKISIEVNNKIFDAKYGRKLQIKYKKRRNSKN